MEYSIVSQEDHDIESTLTQIARWHNLTPKIWLKNYYVTEEAIDETIKKIKITSQSDLFIAVAREADAIIGFLWGNRELDHKNTFMILSLYVENQYRNKGVASSLKTLLEKWCRSNEITTIETTVHYTNKKMIALNQKLGYEAGMVTMRKNL
ncbi:N-acetyltransferase family protein [Fusibacter bizertensis]